MKKIVYLIIFGVLILFVLILSGKVDLNKNNSLQIFEIGSRKVDCVGEGPMKCMVINNELFYGSVEGLDYEEGYSYTIKARVEDIEDPLADASSKKYILVEILSKVKE